MCPFTSEESARNQIRVQQIIIAALATGQILFAGIAISIRMQKPPEPANMISYMSAGMAVLMVLLRMLIGPMTASGQRRRIAAGTWTVAPQARGSLPLEMTDGDKLLLALQAKTILEGALLEGAGFFAIVAYLIEGHVWTLAMAGLLVTIILIPFPSYDRAENWVRQQWELLEIEKSQR